MKNTEYEDSKVNLEQLFNAVTSKPEVANVFLQ
jgi:hypothetical protein